MPIKPEPQPTLHPDTREPLPQRSQPGYYPGFSTVRQKNYWDRATREVVLKRLEPPKPLRFFSSSEAATLEAVVDRIIPQEDRTPDRRIPIVPEIDQRLASGRIDGYRFEDMPPDPDAYRTALRAIEKMADKLRGARFPALETRMQEEILKSIHDGKPEAAQDLWKQMNLDRFWTLLVSDCCSAYYAHPWAWDEIGFGGPAYPRGYMRLENGEPEPWEVREQRYSWTPPADTLSGEEERHGSGQKHQPSPAQGGTH